MKIGWLHSITEPSLFSFLRQVGGGGHMAADLSDGMMPNLQKDIRTPQIQWESLDDHNFNTHIHPLGIPYPYPFEEIWMRLYEKGFQNVKFRPHYGDLFLKVWPNISKNRSEIDSENLKKIDNMFTKRGSKTWNFAPTMIAFSWRSDVTFSRIDSKILKKSDIMFTKRGFKFWSFACYEDSFLKVWPNFSANRFEIDSENLIACLRKGVSNSEVFCHGDLFLKVWSNIF